MSDFRIGLYLPALSAGCFVSVAASPDKLRQLIVLNVKRTDDFKLIEEDFLKAWFCGQFLNVRLPVGSKLKTRSWRRIEKVRMFAFRVGV